MSHPSYSLLLQHIQFKYPQASQPCFRDLDLAVYPGWTGIVGPNGCGKSTLLHLIMGRLSPDSGVLHSTGLLALVEQRTDAPPEQIRQLSDGNQDQAWLWRAKLGIEPEWFDRWDTLSHGERKRIQIACALAGDPDILLLDEPDNHLDGETRDTLLEALQQYQGIGLIVSHDRYLLDALSTHTLFLGGQEPDLRAGNYSQASAEREREQIELGRRKAALRKTEKKFKRELNRRMEAVSRTPALRSRRHIAPGDRDGRAQVGLNIYLGKDKKSGRLKKVMDDRIKGIESELADLHLEKQGVTGIRLEGGVSHHSVLIDVAAGSLQVDPERWIRWPDLILERGQHIGLTGPNGSGKTLLLQMLLERSRLPRDQILYMPQEIPLTRGESLLRDVKRLPSADLTQALTIISRLGSDPERLLEGETLSPGESRKLMLALGMAQSCSLLLLDEPTNHLDLSSIESLQAALQVWPGGILLVSHDRYLVSEIAETTWVLQRENPGLSTLQVQAVRPPSS